MRDVAASVRAAEERQNAKGMIKTDEDIARYQKIIKKTKPEVIVETGTHHGGSAKWFSQFADVITVDIHDNVRENRVDGVTYIHADSSRWTTFHQVEELVAGRSVLVSLDSAHDREHVFKEMTMFSTLVSKGGYMVVEDGIVRQWFEMSGPCDAIERFMDETDEWVMDMDIEDLYPVTLFPMGWMRKVK